MIRAQRGALIGGNSLVAGAPSLERPSLSEVLAVTLPARGFATTLLYPSGAGRAEPVQLAYPHQRLPFNTQ